MNEDNLSFLRAQLRTDMAKQGSPQEIIDNPYWPAWMKDAARAALESADPSAEARLAAILAERLRDWALYGKPGHGR